MSDLSDFSDTDFDRPEPPGDLRSKLSKNLEHLRSLSSIGARKGGEKATSGTPQSSGAKGVSALKLSSKKKHDDKRQTSPRGRLEEEPNGTHNSEKTQKLQQTELKKRSSSVIKDTATGVLSPPDFVFSCVVHDGQVFRARTDHLVVELDNAIYICGGQEGNKVVDEMIKFSPGSNTFSRVDAVGATPPAVLGATLVARRLSAGGSRVLTLFGGIDSKQQHSNETWNFYPETLKWENEKTVSTPTARRGHSMCVGPGAKSLYLWGGLIGDGVQQDGYILSGKKWQKLEQSGTVPPGRCFHSATMATVDNSDAMLVFGGDLSGKSRPTNELWIYYVGRKCWELVENATGEPPGPRFKHAAAYYDGRIWISGGRTAGWFSTYAVSDFFVYDVAAKCWFQCDLAAKELGYHANFGAMALVPQNRAMYIFGGSDSYGNATSGVYRLAPLCTSVSVGDLKQDLQETTAKLDQVRSKVQSSISDGERVKKVVDNLEQQVTASVSKVTEATNAANQLEKDVSEAIDKSLKGKETIKQYEKRLEQLEQKLAAISQLEKKFEIMETSVQDMLVKLEEKADQSSVKAVARKLESLAGAVGEAR